MHSASNPIVNKEELDEWGYVLDPTLEPEKPEKAASELSAEDDGILVVDVTDVIDESRVEQAAPSKEKPAEAPEAMAPAAQPPKAESAAAPVEPIPEAPPLSPRLTQRIANAESAAVSAAVESIVESLVESAITSAVESLEAKSVSAPTAQPPKSAPHEADDFDCDFKAAFPEMLVTGPAPIPLPMPVRIPTPNADDVVPFDIPSPSSDGPMCRQTPDLQDGASSAVYDEKLLPPGAIDSSVELPANIPEVVFLPFHAAKNVAKKVNASTQTQRTPEEISKLLNILSAKQILIRDQLADFFAAEKKLKHGRNEDILDSNKKKRKPQVPDNRSFYSSDEELFARHVEIEFTNLSRRTEIYWKTLRYYNAMILQRHILDINEGIEIYQALINLFEELNLTITSISMDMQKYLKDRRFNEKFEEEFSELSEYILGKINDYYDYDDILKNIVLSNNGLNFEDNLISDGEMDEIAGDYFSLFEPPVTPMSQIQEPLTPNDEKSNLQLTMMQAGLWISDSEDADEEDHEEMEVGSRVAMHGSDHEDNESEVAEADEDLDSEASDAEVRDTDDEEDVDNEVAMAETDDEDVEADADVDDFFEDLELITNNILFINAVIHNLEGLMKICRPEQWGCCFAFIF